MRTASHFPCRTPALLQPRCTVAVLLRGPSSTARDRPRSVHCCASRRPASNRFAPLSIPEPDALRTRIASARTRTRSPFRRASQTLDKAPGIGPTRPPQTVIPITSDVAARIRQQDAQRARKIRSACHADSLRQRQSVTSSGAFSPAPISHLYASPSSGDALLNW